jgi:hypothetical protein
MPVTSAIPLNPMEQEDFARLDYQVMRHAFESQNELGRLCDEVICQNVGEPGPTQCPIGFTGQIRESQKNGVKKMS